MSLGDIYEATWTDAACESSEVTIRDLPKLQRARTYGELVAEDDDSVTLAAEVLESETTETTYRCTTVIPKMWGLKLRRLRKKNE